MKTSLIKYLASICLLLFTAVSPLLAQSPEMADGMRQSGKIYVVVAVIAIIFAGILYFLFVLERRIKKMEDEANGNS